jgi:hypothetical protein
MRNVRLAVMVVAVGLLSMPACSFSSSRSWGSGSAAPSGTGKPARHAGKPARQVDAPQPAASQPADPPKAADPAPAAQPEAKAPERQGRDDVPTREGRADTPTPTSAAKLDTIKAKPATPPGDVGIAAQPAGPAPAGLKAAPVKPQPPTDSKKIAAPQ